MGRKAKPKGYINQKTWLTSGLRRMSYRWPARNKALSASRIERGLYRCASCLNGFPKDQVKIDHIVPVVSVKDGFTTWDDFISRLFCEIEGYQILCSQCHDSKTDLEDQMRKVFRDKKKEEKKDE